MNLNKIVYLEITVILLWKISTYLQLLLKLSKDDEISKYLKTIFTKTKCLVTIFKETLRSVYPVYGFCLHFVDLLQHCCIDESAQVMSISMCLIIIYSTMCGSQAFTCDKIVTIQVFIWETHLSSCPLSNSSTKLVFQRQYGADWLFLNAWLLLVVEGEDRILYILK